MIINKAEPIEIPNRLFINCTDNITYLIAERGKGKSSEVMRQAAIKNAVILAPNSLPYRNYGILHGDDNIDNAGVRYITLGDILKGDTFNLPTQSDNYVHICVDEGRLILQELLSQALDCQIKIDFIATDTGDKFDEEI